MEMPDEKIHTGSELHATVKVLKQRLFAMRNGIVADALRKSWCPHKIIFGLNLPQLTEIAAEFEQSQELADHLFADQALRESVLIAPMLYPHEQLTLERARQLCYGVQWHEDADLLCFKLLKKTDFAEDLADELCKQKDSLLRYTGLRLWLNIVARDPARALLAAQAESENDAPLSMLASMLAEEAKFLLES